MFGEYADLSADLADTAAERPPVGGGWEPLDAGEMKGPATAGGRQSVKLEPGTPVEWGNPTAYGVLTEVNEEAGTALIDPAALDANGYLVSTGGRKLTKALSELRTSDKKAAAEMSLEDLKRPWFELTGEDSRRQREAGEDEHLGTSTRRCAMAVPAPTPGWWPRPRR